MQITVDHKPNQHSSNFAVLAKYLVGLGRVLAEGFFSAKDGFLCSFVQRFRIYVPKWSIRSLRVTSGRLKYHYQI